ncbi:MAG TPA: EAL domain-containing protein [Mycobacteriales bacterium]|nr:EAL domain-containing protein [Mycobacteriales bacterium]
MTTSEADQIAAMLEGIANRQFVLRYQPQVDLASGEVMALEGLVRWDHPQRGLLEPREFLPTAVGSELIVAIGRIVLDECAREVQLWHAMFSPGMTSKKQIWANMSAVELMQPDFVPAVAELLASTGVQPGVLGLEITEGDLIAHSDDLRSTLVALKEIGVLLAVDDFGTWYSSLSGIKHLPIDAVKLGHQFVRGVGQDLDEDHVVEAVIDLAHARGLMVVAEGVESWTEGARLCEMGCDRAHGYLFSGPQEPEQARSLLYRGTGWIAPQPRT